MNNDPAAPQVPLAAGSNDKELTDAALAAASVNPQPTADVSTPAEQPVSAVAQTAPTYPTANPAEATPAPEVIETPSEVTPASDPSVEPSTVPAANPMPAIPVNDSTVPPAEPTQVESPVTPPVEPMGTQPTPGAFGTDTANQTQQSPAKSEGFMAKILNIFKK